MVFILSLTLLNSVASLLLYFIFNISFLAMPVCICAGLVMRVQEGLADWVFSRLSHKHTARILGKPAV